ncbi:hypothetical protein ILYODFUR_034817 [Ilyodon furcidens]|uniref:Uncharacterized protein n=1 Tax=Ilyodon furcidens TaxID=33524 RepID=A0ABV0T2X6_9TELE
MITPDSSRLRDIVWHGLKEAWRPHSISQMEVLKQTQHAPRDPGISEPDPLPPMQTQRQVDTSMNRCGCTNSDAESLNNIQGLDNETETPVILVWEVSWLNWTSLVASLH